MDWDTPRFYAAMDVVVLLTYREGFPNVPLEGGGVMVGERVQLIIEVEAVLQA